MPQAVTWPRLMIDTLRSPAETAEEIIGWQLPRPVLFQAMLAVAAINALLGGLSQLMFPLPEGMPTALLSPLAVFFLVAVGLFVTAYVIYKVGHMMDGRGRFDDILALVVWLQVLRAAAQLAIIVLTFISPGLAALLALAAALYGVYLLLHFINVSLNFGSLAKAAGLLIAVFAALFIGLMLLITLVGGPATAGVFGHV
ncbi:MAG: Yip1 family protein [Pseudomonadota bacterium]